MKTQFTDEEINKMDYEKYEEDSNTPDWIIYEAISAFEQLQSNCKGCEGGCSKCSLRKLLTESIKRSLKDLKKAKYPKKIR